MAALGGEKEGERGVRGAVFWLSSPKFCMTCGVFLRKVVKWLGGNPTGSQPLI